MPSRYPKKYTSDLSKLSSSRGSSTRQAFLLGLPGFAAQQRGNTLDNLPKTCCSGGRIIIDCDAESEKRVDCNGVPASHPQAIT